MHPNFVKVVQAGILPACYLNTAHVACTTKAKMFWLVGSAIAAEQRIQMLKERLRSLGVNPDSLM
jgi:hypothetical protein